MEGPREGGVMNLKRKLIFIPIQHFAIYANYRAHSPEQQKGKNSDTTSTGLHEILPFTKQIISENVCDLRANAESKDGRKR